MQSPLSLGALHTRPNQICLSFKIIRWGGRGRSGYSFYRLLPGGIYLIFSQPMSFGDYNQSVLSITPYLPPQGCVYLSTAGNKWGCLAKWLGCPFRIVKIVVFFSESTSLHAARDHLGGRNEYSCDRLVSCLGRNIHVQRNQGIGLMLLTE